MNYDAPIRRHGGGKSSKFRYHGAGVAIFLVYMLLHVDVPRNTPHIGMNSRPYKSKQASTKGLSKDQKLLIVSEGRRLQHRFYDICRLDELKNVSKIAIQCFYERWLMSRFSPNFTDEGADGNELRCHICGSHSRNYKNMKSLERHWRVHGGKCQVLGKIATVRGYQQYRRRLRLVESIKMARAVGNVSLAEAMESQLISFERNITAASSQMKRPSQQFIYYDKKTSKWRGGFFKMEPSRPDGRVKKWIGSFDSRNDAQYAVEKAVASYWDTFRHEITTEISTLNHSSSTNLTNTLKIMKLKRQLQSVGRYIDIRQNKSQRFETDLQDFENKFRMKRAEIESFDVMYHSQSKHFVCTPPQEWIRGVDVSGTVFPQVQKRPSIDAHASAIKSKLCMLRLQDLESERARLVKEGKIMEAVRLDPEIEALHFDMTTTVLPEDVEARIQAHGLRQVVLETCQAEMAKLNISLNEEHILEENIQWEPRYRGIDGKRYKDNILKMAYSTLLRIRNNSFHHNGRRLSKTQRRNVRAMSAALKLVLIHKTTISRAVREVTDRIESPDTSSSGLYYTLLKFIESKGTVIKINEKKCVQKAGLSATAAHSTPQVIAFTPVVGAYSGEKDPGWELWSPKKTAASPTPQSG
mmetsp:Transcript_24023/g.38719  ORF Transcript_24023/g.38719 Transcript_24023/m.38719 type:complete len:639 (+) Transcript_24023:197-2113(+)